MTLWVNGELVSDDGVAVSAFDHGFTVGDGVFETCKVDSGRAFALTRHLRRLARSASGLGLPPPDETLVRQGVAETLTASPDAGRLRITYTGGPGPLGSERGDKGTTIVVAVSGGGAWEDSTKVSIVPWTRNERSAVAGLKTTSYAENVVALAYARQRGASEAIFANSQGQLCEGTGSNIFAVVDGQLITPTLTSGCLAGITRELVIEWCDVEEVDIEAPALLRASEAFLTSSTRDVQPIHAVDDCDLAAPGSLTSLARKTFLERSTADVDP